MFKSSSPASIGEVSFDAELLPRNRIASPFTDMRTRRDLIGLGVSSIGKIVNTYAQNAKELSAYYALLSNNQLPIRGGTVLFAAL